MSEAFYDKEVAPKLAELSKLCTDKGMSLVACVEYEKNKTGRTLGLCKGAGLEILMVNHCAKTAPNVDGYIMGLIRYCKKFAIPFRDSMVMVQFGDKTTEHEGIDA